MQYFQEYASIDKFGYIYLETYKRNSEIIKLFTNKNELQKTSEFNYAYTFLKNTRGLNTYQMRKIFKKIWHL